jgi:hypothetical protein
MLDQVIDPLKPFRALGAAMENKKIGKADDSQGGINEALSAEVATGFHYCILP